MKSLIAAIVLFTAFAIAAHAEGAERAPKPMVCRAYTIAANLGICQDGKRPVVLTRWSEVKVDGPEGSQPVKVLVGWR